MSWTAERRWSVRVRTAVAIMAACLAVAACGPLAAGQGGAATPASAGLALPASPLVGTWVSEVTRDDLKAGGVTDEGLLDENSGRFTWTFSPDGSWTQVQESLDGASIGAPVFRGLYEVTQDELIQRTTYPEEFAGDRLVFTWRIEDGRLHLDLTNPPDDLLPIVMEAHPWAPAMP